MSSGRNRSNPSHGQSVRYFFVAIPSQRRSDAVPVALHLRKRLSTAADNERRSCVHLFHQNANWLQFQSWIHSVLAVIALTVAGAEAKEESIT